jgi:hypothetical protein
LPSSASLRSPTGAAAGCGRPDNGAARVAHFANTTAYALLAWAGAALVVARIGRTGDCRWWLAGGVVAGLGVADDHSMSFFAIALVIGALLCPCMTGFAPVGKMHSVSDMQDGSQFTDEEEEQGGWRRTPRKSWRRRSGWQIAL